MTTPHFKFFDTVNEEWLEDSYFIRYMQDKDGVIWKITCVDETTVPLLFTSEEMEDVIDVPFSGRFDIDRTPLYKDDIVNCYDKENNEFLFKHVMAGESNILCDCTVFEKYKIKFIGSSLTNPELLEKKL